MFRGVLGDCRLPGSGLVLPGNAGGDALGFRPRPDAAAALASCCGARRRVTLSASGLTGMFDERREPLPEGLRVLLAEIDLVLRAAYREPHRLVGLTPIEIIF